MNMKFNEIVQQFQHNVFGSLSTIRSFKDNDKIWFLGKEIQYFLGHTNITKAIKDANLKPSEVIVFKKINDPKFFDELTNQSLVGFGRFSSSVTLISESGLYKLILRSNKPEAEKFSDWVTNDILPTLRQSIEDHLVLVKASVEIGKHLDVHQQKEESKRINRKNINEVGVNGTVKYNRNSCLDHSGRTPSQLKKWAEENGVPASKRTSGKEVLRLVDMPTASSMSLTDSLVSSGIPYNKALEVSNSAGKELFKKLIEIGVAPKELSL